MVVTHSEYGRFAGPLGLNAETCSALKQGHTSAQINLLVRQTEFFVSGQEHVSGCFVGSLCCAGPPCSIVCITQLHFCLHNGNGGCVSE